MFAVDYTPFDNREGETKEAVVKLNMKDITGVKSDKKVLCGRENGEISELRFNVKPHESVFIELLSEK